MDFGIHAEELWQVYGEMLRQDLKWSQQNHPDGTGEGSTKYLADRAREYCEQRFAEGKGTWYDILTEEYAEAMAETDPEKLSIELLQVAAVCLQWYAAIKRRRARDEAVAD